MPQYGILGEICQRLVEFNQVGVDLEPIRDRLFPPPPPTIYKAPTIYGLHEGPADWMGTTKGWLTFTVNVWEVSRLDYSQLAAQGHSVIVRLNNGYYPNGTIPHMGKYQAFADRCRYVVERSVGARIWVVGNEPNHPQEWPANVKIYPADYADCYRRVRTAIKAACPTDEVLVAPSAPWCALVKYAGNPSGDWVQYLLDVLDRAGDVDGVALHTYTRSHNRDEIAATNLKMGPPFGHRSSNFQCYRDYLTALQLGYAGIPLYITECCPVVSGWDNADRGWVQGAYEEINRWNLTHPAWPIYCLCLYRGAPYDRWYFGDKREVRVDWAYALARNYVNRREA